MSAYVPDPAAASSTRCQQSAPRSGHRLPASNPQQLLYQRLQELRIGRLLFDFDHPVALGVPLNFDVRARHEEDGAHDEPTRVRTRATPWCGADALALLVILDSQVRNLLFTPQVAQGVLQLGELNEEVVLGIEEGSTHRALEVEGQP